MAKVRLLLTNIVKVSSFISWYNYYFSILTYLYNWEIVTLDNMDHVCHEVIITF